MERPARRSQLLTAPSLATYRLVDDLDKATLFEHDQHTLIVPSDSWEFIKGWWTRTGRDLLFCGTTDIIAKDGKKKSVPNVSRGHYKGILDWGYIKARPGTIPNNLSLAEWAKLKDIKCIYPKPTITLRDEETTAIIRYPKKMRERTKDCHLSKWMNFYRSFTSFADVDMEMLNAKKIGVSLLDHEKGFTELLELIQKLPAVIFEAYVKKEKKEPTYSAKQGKRRVLVVIGMQNQWFGPQFLGTSAKFNIAGSEHARKNIVSNVCDLMNAYRRDKKKEDFVLVLEKVHDEFDKTYDPMSPLERSLDEARAFDAGTIDVERLQDIQAQMKGSRVRVHPYQHGEPETTPLQTQLRSLQAYEVAVCGTPGQRDVYNIARAIQSWNYPVAWIHDAIGDLHLPGDAKGEAYESASQKMAIINLSRVCSTQEYLKLIAPESFQNGGGGGSGGGGRKKGEEEDMEDEMLVEPIVLTTTTTTTKPEGKTKPHFPTLLEQMQGTYLDTERNSSSSSSLVHTQLPKQQEEQEEQDQVDPETEQTMSDIFESEETSGL